MHIPQETLPLFGREMPIIAEMPGNPAGDITGGQKQKGQKPKGQKSQPRRAALTPSQRHLAAARRLAKGMWRLPDHSREQTRAGQAICRHLIASLEEFPPAR